MRNVLKWIKTQFSVFEIWSFKIQKMLTIWLKKMYLPKWCAIFWNRFLSSWFFFFFANFNFWVKVTTGLPNRKGFMGIWKPSVRKLWQVFGNPFITLPTIWKERKEKFEIDTVLDQVWGNLCDARSHIKSYEIP